MSSTIIENARRPDGGRQWSLAGSRTGGLADRLIQLGAAVTTALVVATAAPAAEAQSVPGGPGTPGGGGTPTTPPPSLPPSSLPSSTPIADPLEKLPNQDPAQRQMAQSIDAFCPALAGRAAAGASRSSAEEDLARVCTQMIQTADNVLTGSNDSGAFGSFGLTATETNNALQAINGEELQARAIQVGDVQAANITSRLAAVRSGVAGPGFSIVGLDMGFGGTAAADPSAPLAAGAGDEPLLGKLGVFVTGSIQWGERDDTGTIAGFDYTVPGVTAGVDYQFTDNLIAGAAFGYTRFRADFNTSAVSPPGQDLESSNYLFSLFASYYIDDNFFADIIGTVGFGNYQATRHIVIPSMGTAAAVDRFAESEFDSAQWGVSANLGYERSFGPVQVQPIVRVNYLGASIDGATETGAGGLNLAYGDQDVNSLTTRIGLQAAYSVSTAFGILVPYARGEYVHEFLNDPDGTSVRYAADPTGLSAFVAATDEVDRNYGTVGGGLALTLPAGWAAFVDYDALVGFRDLTSHTVSAGFRKNL